MSNYPPGVTGLEPQIAGYDTIERDVDFECNNRPCIFAGTVEAVVQFEGSEAFEIIECPDCEHQVTRDVSEEFEDDRDPDEGREDYLNEF